MRFAVPFEGSLTIVDVHGWCVSTVSLWFFLCLSTVSLWFFLCLSTVEGIYKHTHTQSCMCLLWGRVIFLLTKRGQVCRRYTWVCDYNPLTGDHFGHNTHKTWVNPPTTDTWLLPTVSGKIKKITLTISIDKTQTTVRMSALMQLKHKLSPDVGSYKPTHTHTHTHTFINALIQAWNLVYLLFIKPTIYDNEYHRHTGPVFFWGGGLGGGRGLLPKSCIQYLPENQVVLPKYYVHFCPKIAI